MAMKKTPLLPVVHLGPTRLIAEPDTAARLRKAIPYVAEGSKAFARDLCDKHDTFGGWTVKQQPYAHQLLQLARENYRRLHPRVEAVETDTLYREVTGREPKVSTPSVTPEGMRGLNRLFDAAKDVKKKPFLLITAESLRLKAVPARDGDGYALFDRDDQGSSGFKGTVKSDGRLSLRNAEPRAVADALSRLGEDPARAAKTYALATKGEGRKDYKGQCCFCGLELTHPESVKVGYGPICAGTYNLPHGCK